MADETISNPERDRAGLDGLKPSSSTPSLVRAGPVPAQTAQLLPNKGKMHHARLDANALEAACQMVARGMAVPEIAAVLDVPEARVKRDLNRRGMPQRIRALRAETVRREIEHHFGLLKMLPDSRTALREGLDRGTSKTRSDVARWLHEVLIAKPAQKSEVTIQGKVEHDLSPLLGQISEHLNKIREANQGTDPLARVRRGDEVLVRPQLTSATTEE